MAPTHKLSTRNLTPISSLRITSRQIPAHGLTPNTSLQHKPLLHYHQAFPTSFSISQIQQHLSNVGAVTPQWTYSMYTFSHYHSTSHEVLSIAAGSALCCFGHEDNPERYEALLEKGDVVVVPAGVGHRLLEERERPFTMVGSYPVGKQWDMCYGRDGEDGAHDKVRAQVWFTRDPVYGNEGPVLDV